MADKTSQVPVKPGSMTNFWPGPASILVPSSPYSTQVPEIIWTYSHSV